MAERTAALDATTRFHLGSPRAAWFNAVQGLLILVLLLLSLAFIARQALSWRRATGERRQQLKWLASGAAVSIICLYLAANSSSGSPGHGPRRPRPRRPRARRAMHAKHFSLDISILCLI